MADYDRAMAERVWKRVQSKPTQEGSREQQELNLQRLIMNERMAAAAYLQLSRQMPPKEGARLQRLSREEQAHAACLTGMYRMIHGTGPQVRVPKQEPAQIDALLRKCYAGELRSIADYEAQRDHPEYGHIFAEMARQERTHSRAVLELLGCLQK